MISIYRPSNAPIGHGLIGYELCRETLRSLPPHGVYALCTAEQALAEAGLERDQLSDGDTCIFCASAGSPRFLHHHLGEAEASIHGGWSPPSQESSILTWPPILESKELSPDSSPPVPPARTQSAMLA
jgi:hypothetical protein